MSTFFCFYIFASLSLSLWFATVVLMMNRFVSVANHRVGGAIRGGGRPGRLAPMPLRSGRKLFIRAQMVQGFARWVETAPLLPFYFLKKTIQSRWCEADLNLSLDEKWWRLESNEKPICHARHARAAHTQSSIGSSWRKCRPSRPSPGPATSPSTT